MPEYIGEHIGRNLASGAHSVAAPEDKIVQRATAAILNQIYEEEFLGFSYKFRPRRSQHDALMTGIGGTKVSWIIDADIQSFFDPDTPNAEFNLRSDGRTDKSAGERRIDRLARLDEAADRWDGVGEHRLFRRRRARTRRFARRHRRRSPPARRHRGSTPYWPLSCAAQGRTRLLVLQIGLGHGDADAAGA